MQTTSDLLGFLTAAMVRNSVMTMPALQVTKDFIFNELNETCGRKISSDFKNGGLTLDDIFVHSMLIDDIEMDKPDEYPYVILSFIDENGDKVVLNGEGDKTQNTLDLNSDNFKHLYAFASNLRKRNCPAYESAAQGEEAGTFTYFRYQAYTKNIYDKYTNSYKDILKRDKDTFIVKIPKDFLSSENRYAQYLLACIKNRCSKAGTMTKEWADDLFKNSDDNDEKLEDNNLYNKYKNNSLTLSDVINNTKDGVGSCIRYYLNAANNQVCFIVPIKLVMHNKKRVTFVNMNIDSEMILTFGYIFISDKKYTFPLWVQDDSDAIGYALVYIYYYINSKNLDEITSLSRDEVLEKLEQLYSGFDSYANSFKCHTLSLKDRDIKYMFDILRDNIYINFNPRTRTIDNAVNDNIEDEDEPTQDLNLNYPNLSSIFTKYESNFKKYSNISFEKPDEDDKRWNPKHQSVFTVEKKGGRVRNYWQFFTEKDLEHFYALAYWCFVDDIAVTDDSRIEYLKSLKDITDPVAMINFMQRIPPDSTLYNTRQRTMLGITENGTKEIINLTGMQYGKGVFVDPNAVWCIKLTNGKTPADTTTIKEFNVMVNFSYPTLSDFIGIFISIAHNNKVSKTPYSLNDILSTLKKVDDAYHTPFVEKFKTKSLTPLDAGIFMANRVETEGQIVPRYDFKDGYRALLNIDCDGKQYMKGFLIRNY